MPFDPLFILINLILASGIGQECALAFAAHGAAGVVFADLHLARVQAVAERSAKVASNPSYRALAVSVDVSDLTQVRHMVSQTLSMFGKLDYNVNCAGVSWMTTPIPFVRKSFTNSVRYR